MVLTPLAATPGTCSHGITYSAPFSLTVTTGGTQLQAIATEAANANSPVTSATYYQRNIVLGVTASFNGGPASYTTGSVGPFTPNAGSGIKCGLVYGVFSHGRFGSGQRERNLLRSESELQHVRDTGDGSSVLSLQRHRCGNDRHFHAE